MSIEDALKLISESKIFIEAYRSYGPIATEAIAQLEKMEKLVRERANEEAYKISCSLCEALSAYKSYVPDLAIKLDQIREILKLNC